MIERVLGHYQDMPLTESLILQLHGDMQELLAWCRWADKENYKYLKNSKNLAQ